MPVSQMTRPNGITTEWSYEPHRDLVTEVQNGTVSTYGYVNDAIGRRTSMSRAGSAYATPDVISYAYNDRSELTGAQSNVDSTYIATILPMATGKIILRHYLKEPNKSYIFSFLWVIFPCSVQSRMCIRSFQTMKKSRNYSAPQATSIRGA